MTAENLEAFLMMKELGNIGNQVKLWDFSKGWFMTIKSKGPS